MPTKHKPTKSRKPLVIADYVQVTSLQRLQSGWKGYIVLIEELNGTRRYRVQFHRGEDRYSYDYFTADEIRKARGDA